MKNVNIFLFAVFSVLIQVAVYGSGTIVFSEISISGKLILVSYGIMSICLVVVIMPEVLALLSEIIIRTIRNSMEYFFMFLGAFLTVSFLMVSFPTFGEGVVRSVRIFAEHPFGSFSMIFFIALIVITQTNGKQGKHPKNNNEGSNGNFGGWYLENGTYYYKSKDNNYEANGSNHHKKDKKDKKGKENNTNHNTGAEFNWGLTDNSSAYPRSRHDPPGIGNLGKS